MYCEISHTESVSMCICNVDNCDTVGKNQIEIINYINNMREVLVES